MKYKIGDEFTQKRDAAAFQSGRIVATYRAVPKGGSGLEDFYILEVEGHKDDRFTSEVMLVRREEHWLDQYYNKVELFFKIGKTYRFPGGFGKYLIVDLYDLGKPQALAEFTDGLEKKAMTLLRQRDFENMEEVK